MDAGQEDNDKNRLDESQGYTEWGAYPRRHSWYIPSGRLGRWFSKFFGTKAQAAVAQEFEDETQGPGQERPSHHPLAGDTIINAETLQPEGPAFPSRSRGSLPQAIEIEIDRRRRYQDFELMDEYPEITSAFDVYADDCTQKDTENRRWIVKSEDEMVKEEVTKLFDKIKMDRFYWDIVRNCVKYGDCFTESVINLNNPKAGIQRIKILNPIYIYRVENEFGYLTDFLQEIPEKNEWASYGMAGMSMPGKKYISLDRNQITHFRLHTSDPVFYPYGKSIAAGARQIFRSLRLMEDAMLIYRLARAPERRIFYLDTGNLPATKAQMYVEKTKEKFKKEKFYNVNTGQIDSRYNPLGADEDFFFPMQKGSQTKVETLQGAENLGEVDDVKYFRDKLLAILKIPKDYIVEKDKSPERKANLAQLDVKFAKVICRVQQSMEVGLESIAKRHLQIKEFPQSAIDELRIELPHPSDMFEKRKLDVEEQKARVVQAVMGLQLFPREKIYKDFYHLTDDEIEEIEEKLEKDMEKQMEQQMAMGGGMMGDPMMGGGGAPMGGAPGMEAEPTMGAPSPMSEPEENTPPTESVVFALEKLRNYMLLKEGNSSKNLKKLTKMIAREKNKAKS